jgi:hypothetical protein
MVEVVFEPREKGETSSPVGHIYSVRVERRLHIALDQGRDACLGKLEKTEDDDEKHEEESQRGHFEGTLG